MKRLPLKLLIKKWFPSSWKERLNPLPIVNIPKGSQGYVQRLASFIRATDALSFDELHQDFLPFLPVAPAQILDLGAGIGRDAFVLSERGHQVHALEPLDAFREVGQIRYVSDQLIWVEDSLPELKSLMQSDLRFDFILCSGVWHHLTPEEQLIGLHSVQTLLANGGHFAVSLRHGPAGAGPHVFPIDVAMLLEAAQGIGLLVSLILRDQASLLPNKPDVRWTRLVLQKPAY
ncbi:MAG: class I SAM-dependent methyltransferase [Bacteroidota bacterium]